MRCKKISENLERFLDGTVDYGLKTEIKEHLDKCPSCSNEYAKIGAVRSFFSDSAIPQMPEDIAVNIITAAQNLIHSRQSEEITGISFLWWKESGMPARLAFTVILLMVLTAGIFIGKDLWGRREPLTLAGFPEIEAVSAVQKSSIEHVYLNLTILRQGWDEK